MTLPADTSAKFKTEESAMTVPVDPTDPAPKTRSQPALLMPQAVLSRTAVTLAQTFQGVFSLQTVERCVFESYAALHRTAKVQLHLPSLAQRFAADRLTALAQSQGDAPKDVPEVLFLCVHNAGRSQMAAALLTHRAQGRVHVRSAGSAPAGSLNPVVVSAMAEVGLDLGQEFPKPLTDDVVAAADCVVTMGCGDACPVYPGKVYLDWSLTDPDGADLPTVRGIRDDLDHRVQVLLRELTGPTVSRAQLAALTAGPALPEPPIRERLANASPILQEDSTMTATQPERPSVLFVCVHNAGRSQMAAGFLTARSQGAVEVRSAGSLPGEQVNPAAVAAMAEVGIDISHATPAALTVDAVEASDVVITMGCGDACPVFPGKSYLDWQLEDPAGPGIDAVRPIREQIRVRVQVLLSELLAPADPAR